MITKLLMLPLAPVKGVVWIAEKIADEAYRQFYDPEVLRQQLEDAERAHRLGTISEEELAEIEDDILARMAEGRRLGY
jgi:Gas vesicle protein G